MLYDCLYKSGYQAAQDLRKSNIFTVYYNKKITYSKMKKKTFVSFRSSLKT